MKIGIKVFTEYGRGTIVLREAESGFLSRSYCVKLDSTKKLDDGLRVLHEHQGGLYFIDKEIVNAKELEEAIHDETTG